MNEKTSVTRHDRQAAGRAIRAARTRAGLSQAQLAGKLSPRRVANDVSAWECSGASAQALEMVAGALGTTPEEMLRRRHGDAAKGVAEPLPPPATASVLEEMIVRHHGVIQRVADELAAREQRPITRQAAAARIARAGLLGVVEQARAGHSGG